MSARSTKHRQTNSEQGHFRQGDSHPDGTDSVFYRYSNGKEVWLSSEALQKRREYRASYYKKHRDSAIINAVDWQRKNPPKFPPKWRDIG